MTKNIVSTKKEVLLKISQKINDVFRESLDDPNINTNINVALDNFDLINNWCELLKHHDANVVLQEASYRMLSSMHIALSGFYREAYLSLRSALESACYFIYFVDNNYAYLKWKKNIIDINWSNLKEEESGILANKYLKLHGGDFYIEKLLNDINDIYRICSEYVHGKYDYMFINKFSRIQYNSEGLEEFFNIYLRVAKVIIFLISIRFKERRIDIKKDYKSIIEDELRRYGYKFTEE